MAVLRCTTPFATAGPVPRVVSGGELVDSADPVVKGREENFEPVEAFMARRAGVEQATAAPGEKRTVTRKTAKG